MVVFFDVPLAVGEEDGVELEAFGFVYGEDADALVGAAGDGEGVVCVVPTGEEGVYVVGVVAEVGAEGVEECEVGGFLSAEFVEV